MLTNVDLPKELYIYLLALADDVNVTKALRSVSKTAHASYDYFKLLLNQPMFIYYHPHIWGVCEQQPDLKKLNEDYHKIWYTHSHGTNTDSPGRSMKFKTTVYKLYDLFNNYL